MTEIKKRSTIPLPKCTGEDGTHDWQKRPDGGHWGGPDSWCSQCGIWRKDYQSVIPAEPAPAADAGAAVPAGGADGAS